MVVQSTTERGSRRRPIREFSEIIASVTRGDITAAWALVCAIAIVALIVL